MWITGLTWLMTDTRRASAPQQTDRCVQMLRLAWLHLQLLHCPHAAAERNCCEQNCSFGQIFKIPPEGIRNMKKLIVCVCVCCEAAVRMEKRRHCLLEWDKHLFLGLETFTAHE